MKILFFYIISKDFFNYIGFCCFGLFQIWVLGTYFGTVCFRKDDVDTWKRHKVDSPVLCASGCPRAGLAAAGCSNGVVRLWNLSSGELVR